MFYTFICRAKKSATTLHLKEILCLNELLRPHKKRPLYAFLTTIITLTPLTLKRNLRNCVGNLYAT